MALCALSTTSVFATNANVSANPVANSTAAIVFKADPANPRACQPIDTITYQYSLDPSQTKALDIKNSKLYRKLILVDGSMPFGKNKTIRGFMNIIEGEAPSINLYGVFVADHSQNAGIYTQDIGPTKCSGTFVSNTISGDSQ